MKALHMITFILLIVGGLNWLLFGLVGWDISSWFGIGGMGSTLARAIYIIVGIAAVVELLTHKSMCKMCN